MKNILLAVLGALSALFYALNKSKDRKIEKLEQENQSHKQKAEEKEFIANEQIKTQINQSDDSNMSDDDVKRLYKSNNWLDD